MNQNPENVKEKINLILSHMEKHSYLFVNRPGHDFMRQYFGKLTFSDTMKLILSMEKSTVSNEIINYFDMDVDRIPTPSAFNQRRNQLSLFAFQYLFNEFSVSFPQVTHQFKDRCILAFDGTHIVYTTNSEILEDYNKPRLKDYKGYNHMHLNGFVDVISKAFLDIRIQPGQEPDERAALHDMLAHFDPDDPERYIITADRGYESYDLLFHCLLKKLSFVFRAKAPSSNTALLASFADDLPDDQEEFDITIERFFTDKKNKIIKEQTSVYQYMNPNKNIPHFKPLLAGRDAVYIRFRILKIKTSDATWEYIITNLPDSFDLDDIKECYHWRWGIETAFRYLKHAAGLLYFHSKKAEYVQQEIYASLVMYNFGIFLANEAAKENQKKERKDGNKYKYTVDISTALRQTRNYYRRKPSEKPVDIIGLLCKFVHAEKEKFRQFPRPLHGIGAIRFAYR